MHVVAGGLESDDDFAAEEVPREIVWEEVTGEVISPLPLEGIADWRVEHELGRGGMGAVHAVVHRDFGKRAALKLSHTSLDAGGLGAKVFLREASVVQLIDHPSIPDVFATGVHDGRPYLVMERLRGETLAQLLARGALGRTQALEILIDLCAVLEAAHRARVVHRDLKLDNVFLLERPGAGGVRLKLLDWGCAHVLDEDDPLRGMIAGTLTYVAPEQVFGRPITPASDVYSLGVLAYRMLLGAAPFTGNSDVELVRRHISEPPPDPALWWPDIPRRLADLLRAMLAKEPSERPALADIRVALTGMPALARAIEMVALTPSLRPRLHQRVVGVALGIACAIAGAVAMFGA